MRHSDHVRGIKVPDRSVLPVTVSISRGIGTGINRRRAKEHTPERETLRHPTCKNCCFTTEFSAVPRGARALYITLFEKHETKELDKIEIQAAGVLLKLHGRRSTPRSLIITR